MTTARRIRRRLNGHDPRERTRRRRQVHASIRQLYDASWVQRKRAPHCILLGEDAARYYDHRDYEGVPVWEFYGLGPEDVVACDVKEFWGVAASVLADMLGVVTFG